MWVLAIIMLLPLLEATTVIKDDYATQAECESEGRRIWSEMDASYPEDQQAAYQFACFNRATKEGRIIDRGE